MEDSDHQDYIAPLERDIDYIKGQISQIKDNMFAMQQEFRKAYADLKRAPEKEELHHKDSDEDKCHAFLERFD